MANGQLEKMRIYAYNNPELSSEHEVGEFVAMMNAETYAIETKMEFNLEQGQGTSGSEPRFELKQPEEMAFEFLFDNTGIIDGESREDIADEIIEYFLPTFAMTYGWSKIYYGCRRVCNVSTQCHIRY